MTYLITFSDKDNQALEDAKSILSNYDIEYVTFKHMKEHKGLGFKISKPEFYQLGLFEGLVSLPNSKLEQANVFHPIKEDSLEDKVDKKD